MDPSVRLHLPEPCLRSARHHERRAADATHDPRDLSIQELCLNALHDPTDEIASSVRRNALKSPRHSEAEKSVKRVAPVMDWYCALGYSVS